MQEDWEGEHSILGENLVNKVGFSSFQPVASFFVCPGREDGAAKTAWGLSLDGCAASELPSARKRESYRWEQARECKNTP